MRIIYLHQYFVTPEMPGGTRSYEMARRLVAAGHEVHMVTTDQEAGDHEASWRNSTEAGINVHWANVRYSSHMGYLRRLLAFVSFAVRATLKSARLQGDIVFATSTPLTIAIPGLLASAWKRIPFVFEVRDMWPDVPIAIGAIRNPVLVWLARQLEILTYRRAARVVALAPGMREDIIAKGIDPQKVTVIPNGCDLDVFATRSSEHAPRQSHDWLGERKLVLFAGTLGKINGMGYLVELASRVAALDPEIRFVVIGAGAECAATRLLAHEKGVLGTNFFMLNPLPKRELAPWMHAADLIVALFTGPRVVWKDAVQNKFFDALAAGKPIASNFDGWQTQVAAQADIGFILDPQDIGAAAKRLIDALADEPWMRAVPQRARVLAEGRFNRDNLAADLERVLTDTIDVTDAQKKGSRE